MAKDQYPLPLYLLPTSPVDRADIKYTKHSHSIIIHPFEKYLNAKSYNETHFFVSAITYP